jgi:hypothetical protein
MKSRWIIKSVAAIDGDGDTITFNGEKELNDFYNSMYDASGINKFVVPPKLPYLVSEQCACLRTQTIQTVSTSVSNQISAHQLFIDVSFACTLLSPSPIRLSDMLLFIHSIVSSLRMPSPSCRLT